MKPISVTGIKPTGNPHIGNYLGMYRPAMELMEEYQAMYFVADYHALTTMRDAQKLRDLVYEVAASWLALGLDPEKAIFFRQSDIPEIPEFAWILACFTSKGLLNRAHAYKDAVDANLANNHDPDEGINSGLFYYPVLMAADILLYGSAVVPVGSGPKAAYRDHPRYRRSLQPDLWRSAHCAGRHHPGIGQKRSPVWMAAR